MAARRRRASRGIASGAVMTALTALVILGGPMSVHDYPRLAYLLQEERAVRRDADEGLARLLEREAVGDAEREDDGEGCPG